MYAHLGYVNSCARPSNINMIPKNPYECCDLLRNKLNKLLLLRISLLLHPSYISTVTGSSLIQIGTFYLGNPSHTQCILLADKICMKPTSLLSLVSECILYGFYTSKSILREMGIINT